MPLAEVARLATDLVQALTTVHEAGYVHCDVSVGNVVIACDECDKQLVTLAPKDDAPRCPHVAATQPAVERPPRRYRLIDFGLCQKIDDTNAVTSACGTPGFVAPEITQVPPAAAAGASAALGMIPSFQLDPPQHPPSYSPQAWQLPQSPSLGARSMSHLNISSLWGGMSSPMYSAADSGLGGCGGSTYALSEVSSLASSPPSDRMSFFAGSVDGSVNSPRLAALRSSTPSPPTAWRDLRFRLSAARDVYSVGVVVGLVLSGYLPLCDADHLGCPRSSPDYVRAHVTPRLRVFRKVLADNVHLVAPARSRCLTGPWISCCGVLPIRHVHARLRKSCYAGTQCASGCWEPRPRLMTWRCLCAWWIRQRGAGRRVIPS
ncbi:hypothetical protein BCR44DRAFT_1250021 [Catenaria anguillulae PL171]|uniref:Protein kinase domain-containing protein n=1 Tax=Catenaria anguillulae PL171 TaxID=765915 RepID=A0A1Y2I0S2_9FUNG|nr:hypothetical protein BCR44DRAFT_1250021 [Catenaria anguillulae PL171]